MRKIISALGVAFILFGFTFYIDGEIGVILSAFMIFAVAFSVGAALYSRKRVNIGFDCDGYVKKGSKLTVRVTVEKTGRIPLGIICIDTAASEVFGSPKKTFKLSLAGSDTYSFDYELDAKVGGNGEISVTSVRSAGFMGFIGFKCTCDLPQPKSVGVIPEIPQIKASSMLFRNIADSVLTSDEEESSDASMLFSANTSPGYEHREYVDGDPLKRVNWKLSVKKNKMMVRLDEAVASVQPVVVFDLFRSGDPVTKRQTAVPTKPTEESVLDEEKLICSVFGLVELLVKQGIACTFVYYGADGEIVTESVDNPDAPSQLLLKVLAAKVVPNRHIKAANISACACVIATTYCDHEVGSIINTLEDRDSAIIIGATRDTPNLTDSSMWYLDGDNNFKQKQQTGTYL